MILFKLKVVDYDSECFKRWEWSFGLSAKDAIRNSRVDSSTEIVWECDHVQHGMLLHSYRGVIFHGGLAIEDPDLFVSQFWNITACKCSISIVGTKGYVHKRVLTGEFSPELELCDRWYLFQYGEFSKGYGRFTEIESMAQMISLLKIEGVPLFTC